MAQTNSIYTLRCNQEDYIDELLYEEHFIENEMKNILNKMKKQLDYYKTNPLIYNQVCNDRNRAIVKSLKNIKASQD